jgi:hypothetical protein
MGLGDPEFIPTMLLHPAQSETLEKFVPAGLRAISYMGDGVFSAHDFMQPLCPAPLGRPSLRLVVINKLPYDVVEDPRSFSGTGHKAWMRYRTARKVFDINDVRDYGEAGFNKPDIYTNFKYDKPGWIPGEMIYWNEPNYGVGTYLFVAPEQHGRARQIYGSIKFDGVGQGSGKQFGISWRVEDGGWGKQSDFVVSVNIDYWGSLQKLADNKVAKVKDGKAFTISRSSVNVSDGTRIRARMTANFRASAGEPFVKGGWTLIAILEPKE